MTPRLCIQCGNPLPAHAQFCGQCGTVNALPGGPTAPPPPPGASPPLAEPPRTILQPARPPAPAQAAPPPPGGGGPLKQTMLGFAGAPPAPPELRAAPP